MSFTSGRLLAGVPDVTGNWPVTFEVSDGASTASRAFTLTVAGVPGRAPLAQQLRQLITAENIQPLNPPQPPAAINRTQEIPQTVPSGLPVDR